MIMLFACSKILLVLITRNQRKFHTSQLHLQDLTGPAPFALSGFAPAACSLNTQIPNAGPSPLGSWWSVLQHLFPQSQPQSPWKRKRIWPLIQKQDFYMGLPTGRNMKETTLTHPDKVFWCTLHSEINWHPAFTCPKIGTEGLSLWWHIVAPPLFCLLKHVTPLARGWSFRGLLKLHSKKYLFSWSSIQLLHLKKALRG